MRRYGWWLAVLAYLAMINGIAWAFITESQRLGFFWLTLAAVVYTLVSWVITIVTLVLTIDWLHPRRTR